VEVVFELRWKLKGSEGVPPPLRQDPGYFVCLESFFPKMKEYGFADSKRTQADATFPQAYAVEYRFYRKLGQDFPTIQIGPGLLAVNDSSGYVWDDYSHLCVDALERFLGSYPKLRMNPLVPIQLELKYIDAFEPSASTGKDLLSFLTKSTNFGISLPSVLESSVFDSVKSGQINLVFPVKGKADTNFVVQLANGEVSGVPSIILQSSVITTCPAISIGESIRATATHLNRWLNEAHSCTSPFFKGFVKDSLLKQFEKANDV
jgi:uncharacterized protein (TIGR04255 family)